MPLKDELNIGYRSTQAFARALLRRCTQKVFARGKEKVPPILRLSKEVRALIFDEVFKDREVAAFSDETSGELVLHPADLCVAAKDASWETLLAPHGHHQIPASNRDLMGYMALKYDHTALAITLVNKQIRDEALARLWTKVVTVSMGSSPKKPEVESTLLKVLPHSCLSNVRILHVPYISSRLSTIFRAELLPSLKAVIIEPFPDSSFNQVTLTPTECWDELDDSWRVFENSFIFRDDRDRNTIVDEFLDERGVPKEGVEVMYRQKTTFESEFNRAFYEGFLRMHYYFLHSVNERRCVYAYKSHKRVKWVH